MPVMNLDDQGRKDLAGVEAIKLEAYLDIEGVPTIGIGMTKYPDGRKVKIGDKLKSVEEAKELFDKLVKNYVDCVNKYLLVKVTQKQFNVLVSMCYNIGEEGFRTSGLLNALNTGRINALASEFHKWVGITKKNVNPNKLRNEDQKSAYFLNSGALHPSEGLYNRRDKEFREFMGWGRNVL